MEVPTLVIDDSDIDQYLIKRQLTESKFASRVFSKFNGQEALEFLSDYAANKIQYKDDYPPSVILLDINMPLMNGFEFLEKFKKLREEHDYCSTSIIVFLTSSSDEKDINQATQYDFVKGYIHKPLDITQLQELVSN